MYMIGRRKIIVEEFFESVQFWYLVYCILSTWKPTTLLSAYFVSHFSHIEKKTV